MTQKEFLENVDKSITAIDYTIEKIELESIQKPLKLLFFKLDFKFY